MDERVLSKSEILEAIRAHVAEHGRPPGMKAFKTQHVVPSSAFYGMYWARWTDAVRDAGFEPLERMPRTDPSVLFEALASLTRSLGRFPTKGELRLQKKLEPGFPAVNVFTRHIGPSAEQVAELRAWCQAREDLRDILALLPETPEPTPDGVVAPDPAGGFVYLLKSGRFYKIGQTTSVPRRWAEIAGAAPEAVELVHYFRTDDRLGIEQYWHRRFAHVRHGGEWFDLATNDVAAFRRRKSFM